MTALLYQHTLIMCFADSAYIKSLIQVKLCHIHLHCSYFIVSTLVQANVADYGDNQWVTCFQESAEAILGQNAAYLGQLKDSVRFRI